MSLKCSEVIKYIEMLCPRVLAVEWDNVGLLVGDSNQDIRKILIALDATNEVIEEAIHNRIDMIVTHHPLFNPKFNGPIRSITNDTSLGKLLYKLIKNNICLYSAHTNLDIADGGVNDVLARLLDLNNIGPLEIVGNEKLKKLVIFVPEGYEEEVRRALAEAGAGLIGKYSDCSFTSEGIGIYKALEDAKPFIGELGVLEKVKEYRIETIFNEAIQSKVIKAMINAHPYEEVAYDIYPLDNKGEAYGLGRVGELQSECSMFDFAKSIKHKLMTDNVRVIGDVKEKVRKVAICSGSGMSLLNHAVASGADVYVTGDVKYHEAQDALANGIKVIDAGHYHTENIIVPVLKSYIQKLDGIEVSESKVDANPFAIL